MPKVIICKGLPASGKSTWAKAYVAKNAHDWKRVNKDDLRSMIQADKWSGKLERQVVKTRDAMIRAWLGEGLSVIVDDTNLNPIHEDRIKDIAKSFGADVETKWFHVDVDEAIKRDLKREKSVGERVIRDMYNKWIREDVEPMIQDTALIRAIIVDIDGTVAKMDGRKPYDWHLVGTDKPNAPVIEVVRKFANTHFIIFLSGRDGVCQDDTYKWLLANVVNGSGTEFNFTLHMRTPDDNRKDSIIKRELFDRHVRDQFYVDFVLDDRNQVVDMWRNELGLTCLQVAEGDF